MSVTIIKHGNRAERSVVITCKECNCIFEATTCEFSTDTEDEELRSIKCPECHSLRFVTKYELNEA